VGGKRPETADPGSVEIWGVLNVTPDSFSDGGLWIRPEDAIAHGLRMHAEGAAVIDVGGASSRPAGPIYGRGAPEVPPSEEMARVLPVVRELARRGVRVSIDTTRAEVARAAIEAGAAIVNDVSMGESEALVEHVAASGVELVLMHTRERGRVDAVTTAYRDVVEDVRAELGRAVERAVARGVPASRIWIDPGIGFAKTAAQSVTLLAAIERLVATGHRVLVGASRKSFIGTLAPRADGSSPSPTERLPGSLAALTAAILAGAHAVRVHDVSESVQAAKVARALRDARRVWMASDRTAERGRPHA
jgi:dihydropteroate synthase